ncbi:hypothetical protein [Saccharospirillum impatiens]|uniref:hypothetical protein n=1 Tax=Saccharospirillum impatiens TaxID=169438 RepID=UPI000421BE5E|nr:hypothetical protein [Saccharospirillum impatiens]
MTIQTHRSLTPTKPLATLTVVAALSASLLIAGCKPPPELAPYQERDIRDDVFYFVGSS